MQPLVTRLPLVGIVLAATLAFAQPPTEPVARSPTTGADEAGRQTATSPVAEPEADRGRFDPGQVGLPGFPSTLETPEDYSRAETLVKARIAELTEARRLDQQGVTGGSPRQDEADGEAVSAGADSAPDSAPEAATAVDDERIELLEGLLDAIERSAAILSRTREIEAALAAQERAAAALAEEGLGSEPPYSVTQFDQIRGEHGLTAHSADMTSRMLAQARQRAESTARALDQAVRERRAIRNRPEQADDEQKRLSLATQLEEARLNELLLRLRRDAALAQQQLAAQENALAREQQALLGAKLELMRPHLNFSREALDERLAEVDSREQALLEQIETLNRAGDVAESQRHRLQLRLQSTSPDTDTKPLEAWLQTREDQLAAARKGAGYLRQALELADSARTMLQRRYTLLQGAEQEQWTTWLRETDQLRRTLADDKRFIDTELGALRSIQLALSRRLAAPDLNAEVRKALDERVAALEQQEQSAEALLSVQDQIRSLAERLREGLDPLVRERSLAQKLEQARALAASAWGHELFAVDDQGVYAGDLVTAFAVFLLVLFFVSLLKSLLRRKLLPRLTLGDSGEQRKTSRAVASALIRNTSQWFVLIVAFYLAMAVSGLGQGKLQHWLETVLIVVLYLQIGLWANAGVVDYFLRKRSKLERQDPSAVTGYGLLLFFMRAGIWIVVVVSVLTHFKYPIAGLIGALGVGGIAVAFAVQNILGDVFSSLAIILDKPFRVGDFIITGETLGVIEHIGVKTTRIRSLSGELVVMSNTDLLGSCIHNFKHMRERRVVFKLGVVYQTSADKLEQIPRTIEQIIRAQPQARFDRAHFAEYGDFALIFEIVYYVIGADFTLYMDTQQAINLAIYRAFQEDGIEFAYPTQQVYVSQMPQTPPSPAVDVGARKTAS